MCNYEREAGRCYQRQKTTYRRHRSEAAGVAATLATRLRQAWHMNSAFIYSFIIGAVGAALFLFVDKYERDGMVANLLKFLVLVVGGVAILHKLKPFGLALF
jgi:hypothetical protein